MKKLDFETEEERKNYMKEYKKKYYEENKEKIKYQQGTTTHCQFCDSDVLSHRYKRHCKSARH
jgi:chemotaxis methyl-accepting protein methylase